MFTMKVLVLSLISLVAIATVEANGLKVRRLNVEGPAVDTQNRGFGDDDDDSGPRSYHPLGYKQLNTLLSHAYMQIIIDQQYKLINDYGGGFGSATGNVVDPSSCLRRYDKREQGRPAGILWEAVETGIFKWCLSEDDFAPVFPAIQGGISVATEANPIQGIKVGDFFGAPIDEINAVTNQMSLILGVSLCPELVVLPRSDDGYFEGVYNGLANNDCYATISWFSKQPSREKVVDFTCNVIQADTEGFGIHTTEETGLDLSAVILDKGAGVSICYFAGTIQSALIDRTFPSATLVTVSNTAYPETVCSGGCQAYVDAFNQTAQFDLAASCAGEKLVSKKIASLSSGGGAAAMTLKPNHNTCGV